MPAAATAFVHRDDRFLLKHGWRPGRRGAARRAARRWLARTRTPAPARHRPRYQNFPDPELDDPRRAYHGANLERLRAAKARYDPTGERGLAQSL